MSELSWLVEFIRDQGQKSMGPSVLLGQVLTVPPSLVVRVQGMDLMVEDLYISSSLLLPDALRIGDRVTLMPLAGGQQFIVLSKVVKMGE
ncbi:hypothetical protein [Paenibacillus guangzhouensis]|uniref:hypothetical protein n=1 Tax=Paenibacillus guangzhouensis TaxID=1473112 RepID=UPI001267328F|nr:hypothetical protein [Paenibacillus guangzhouensis]